jgi:hypothetical protein
MYSFLEAVDVNMQWHGLSLNPRFWEISISHPEILEQLNAEKMQI